MEDFEEIPESSGYRPLSPELRGRHASFASAVDAAFGDLTTEKNEFFDSLADRWKTLFPDLPARPGRYEDGKIFLYVPNAAVNFMVRPRLAAIKKLLAALPDAPKRIESPKS